MVRGGAYQIYHRGGGQIFVSILIGVLVFAAGGFGGYFTSAYLVKNDQPEKHRQVALASPIHSAQKNTVSTTAALPVPSSYQAKIADAFVPDFTLPTPKEGMSPVLSRIPTKQPVVFLGIDDGAYKDPSVVQLMANNHIKASLFLSKTFIASDPDFFKQLTAEGSLVEDHTLSHDIDMTSNQSYDQQKAEICGMADYEQQAYGRRPILFRPPGGKYSETLQKAAYDCGMKAIVNWIAKANGGSMQYQAGDRLQAGDIVLMHFRPSFKEDTQAFVDVENVAGLHTELIEDAVK